MEGIIIDGWYAHPTLGNIKIYLSKSDQWVYQCYSKDGSRALSKERAVDQWTWVLCEKTAITDDL